MALPNNWATLEDFATLFQYFWHRDFPIDSNSPGAKRTDWTIHTGIVVRSIADLMGLVTRFEVGGRKDAVLRSFEGDEIAIEWEWQPEINQELKKLKNHKVWSKGGQKTQLRFAVLITYAGYGTREEVCRNIAEYWHESNWPLLLILILTKPSKELSSRREFISLNMYKLDNDFAKDKIPFRSSPAIPLGAISTRWSPLEKA